MAASRRLAVVRLKAHCSTLRPASRTATHRSDGRPYSLCRIGVTSTFLCAATCAHCFPSFARRHQDAVLHAHDPLCAPGESVIMLESSRSSVAQVGPPAILLGQAVFADASAVSVRSLVRSSLTVDVVTPHIAQTLLTFAALARHARLFSDLSTGSRSLLSGATFDVLASAIVLATLAITLRRRDHDLARFDALSRGWLLFAPSIFSLLVPVTQCVRCCITVSSKDCMQTLQYCRLHL